MLLLAGRGFPSYGLYTAAVATGAGLLWRVPASFALPVKKRLADGTCLSELRGTRRTESVTVRAIKYSVADDDGVSDAAAGAQQFSYSYTPLVLAIREQGITHAFPTHKSERAQTA